MSKKFWTKEERAHFGTPLTDEERDALLRGGMDLTPLTPESRLRLCWNTLRSFGYRVFYGRDISPS
jgi:hypothetical protein